LITLPIVSSRELIATATRPLRASSLPKLLECPGRVFLSEEFWQLMIDDSDDSGPAAQTGSLLHVGAEAFHKTQDTEAGRVAIDTFRVNFPKADSKRALKIYEAYIADPKNKNARIIQLEQKIKYEHPCAPFDPTGQPICIIGTLDQIRESEDGKKTVWDIKTGTTYYGTKAINHYMAQQAAYTLASGVEPGGLICTDGYFRPGGKVFFRYECTLEDFKQALDSVAVYVAFARMGRVIRTSGDYCDYCDHKNFNNCSSFVKGHTY